MLRIGAGVRNKPKAGEPLRVRPDGREILGGSVENKTVPPIEMPGKFFAESAG